MKNIKVAAEAKAGTKCGGGEEEASPHFSSLSSKPYDSSTTLALAPGLLKLHAGASPQ